MAQSSSYPASTGYQAILHCRRKEAFILTLAHRSCRNLCNFSIGILQSILCHLQNKSNIFCCILFSCMYRIFFHSFSFQALLSSCFTQLLPFPWSLFYFCNLNTCIKMCKLHYFENICNKILNIEYAYSCSTRLDLLKAKHFSFGYMFSSSFL